MTTREALDAKIASMRARASNLISWYTNSPSAAEVLDLLDAVEHEFYVMQSSGHT